MDKKFEINGYTFTITPGTAGVVNVVYKSWPKTPVKSVFIPKHVLLALAVELLREEMLRKISSAANGNLLDWFVEIGTRR